MRAYSKYHDSEVLIACNKSWCFKHIIVMKGLGAYDGTDSVTKICSLIIYFLSCFYVCLKLLHIIEISSFYLYQIQFMWILNCSINIYEIRLVYIVDNFLNTPSICVTFFLQLLSSLASGKIQTFFFFDSIFYKAV